MLAPSGRQTIDSLSENCGRPPVDLFEDGRRSARRPNQIVASIVGRPQHDRVPGERVERPFDQFVGQAWRVRPNQHRPLGPLAKRPLKMALHSSAEISLRLRRHTPRVARQGNKLRQPLRRGEGHNSPLARMGKPRQQCLDEGAMRPRGRHGADRRRQAGLDRARLPISREKA
jgi:hypothetical protein